MKEKIKEIAYWFEDKLKDLCGELTPDKRITVILIMLLILVIGNLYFTFSTIYNWGKDSERKKQIEIERIEQLELMDSPIDKELFDLYKQRQIQDSIEEVNINKEKIKAYERTIKNKYGAKTKA